MKCYIKNKWTVIYEKWNVIYKKWNVIYITNGNVVEKQMKS